MKEFMLVFRRDVVSKQPQQSPEEMQRLWRAWQDWIGSVAAQNKLSATGKRLAIEGKVMKPGGTVTNGPYVELKESVVGYMFVRAQSIDDAIALAKGCPNLAMGGTVEVRSVYGDDGLE